MEISMNTKCFVVVFLVQERRIKQICKFIKSSNMKKLTVYLGKKEMI